MHASSQYSTVESRKTGQLGLRDRAHLPLRSSHRNHVVRYQRLCLWRNVYIKDVNQTFHTHRDNETSQSESANSLWYEEPIVIEPEKTISSGHEWTQRHMSYRHVPVEPEPEAKAEPLDYACMRTFSVRNSGEDRREIRKGPGRHYRLDHCVRYHSSGPKGHGEWTSAIMHGTHQMRDPTPEKAHLGYDSSRCRPNLQRTRCLRQSR